MDGNRFDDLARALGARRNRRSVLKSFGAAALGAAALAGVKTGAGANDGKVAVCHYDADSGTFHEINVSVNSVTYKAHLAHGDVPATGYGTGEHCGGCGDACGAGQACCGGVCTDLGTVDNCSACADLCTAVDTCTAASCDGGVCNTATACAPVDACTPARCDGVDICNQVSACTGFDTCGGGGVADACGCSGTCTACGQVVCGVTCTGAAQAGTVLGAITWTQSPINADYCDPTIHLTGFPGCSTITAQYWAALTSTGGTPIRYPDRFLQTDFTGASHTKISRYVKGQYIDIRLPDYGIDGLATGWTKSSC